MSIPLEIDMLYDMNPVESDRRHPRLSLREADDAALVSWAATGDDGAFEELVRRYRSDVFRVCNHFVRNREDAWDLSQEVFIKAHRALGRFRGEASFKTWLLRISANACKDFFKKRRLATVPFDERIGSDSSPSPMAGPGHQAQAGELGRAIEVAVDGLSAKHRTVFVLREYEGLSYEEMAEVIGCSVGTVMSRLFHARKKLQSALLETGLVEG